MDTKKENQIMDILKVKEITVHIYKTPLGELTAKRNKDSNTYTFMLDSVILPKETQKELSELWGIN